MAVCVSNRCILTAKSRVLVTFSPWSYGNIGLNPAFIPIPGKWVENVERGDLTLHPARCGHVPAPSPPPTARGPQSTDFKYLI